MNHDLNISFNPRELEEEDEEDGQRAIVEWGGDVGVPEINDGCQVWKRGVLAREIRCHVSERESQIREIRDNLRGFPNLASQGINRSIIVLSRSANQP